MTKLKGTATVKRETSAVYRGNVIVVELHANFMRLRFKGKQTAHCLDYAVALECAQKVEAREAGVKI